MPPSGQGFANLSIQPAPRQTLIHTQKEKNLLEPFCEGQEWQIRIIQDEVSRSQSHTRQENLHGGAV